MTDTYIAWTVLADRAPAEALAEQLEALEPSGVGSFEIEDGSGRWEVTAYFLTPPDGIALAIAAAAYGAQDFVVSAVEDRDWVAQVRRELTPVRAGRVVVHGAHDRAAVKAHEIGLEIEAAMAFGTGHHGTTEGCLLALDRLKRSGFRPRRVADIGCGTAVLAMGAAKLWPCVAIASDVDQVAVATARANIAANGLQGRIATLEASGVTAPRIRGGAPYDLVLCNILAKPLKRLSRPIAAIARPGSGVVVLSGLLSRQRNDVAATYRALGYTPLFEIERRGWATLAYRAPASRRRA